jgi:hypothetical protein
MGTLNPKPHLDGVRRISIKATLELIFKLKVWQNMAFTM